ncbi:MAG TPA: ATP-binding protein [Vicinamibacterales bacterium]|nr:ATP-binding protein [Vicinamibacterales bacterium]
MGAANLPDPRGLALRVGLALGALAGATALFHFVVPANPTTVALSYLLLVLLTATEWGLLEATLLAAAASLAYNLFFLPPVGRLTIADAENWASFFAFMLTAIVVSQLSGRARARHLEAVARQRDLERLYTLSRGLLLAEEGGAAPAGIARHIADAFELEGLALYDQHTGTIVRAGRTDLPEVDARLRDVARQATTWREPGGIVVTAVRLGQAPIGSLALQGGTMSDTVLQSVVNLAAIGLERAREREAATATEAARRSGELRAALLDAVAHEFKTPLTSIRAAAGGLTGLVTTGDARELLAIVDEESARLQGLVSDAIRMFHVEVGDFEVRRERHDLRGLVDRVIRELGARLAGRPVTNRIMPDVIVEADADLLGLALRQLVDNAAKYSSPGSAIDVDASMGSGVDVVVRNLGPAIPEHERDRIFERFVRGAQASRLPGSGMGLAIVRRIAQAHGGDVTAASSGGVTEFRLSLPRVEVPR